MLLDEIREEIYQNTDQISSVVFLANIHPGFINYTVTVTWLPTDPPMQYAFKSTDEATVFLFSAFHYDLYALDEFYLEKSQNEYGNRKQLRYTRT